MSRSICVWAAVGTATVALAFAGLSVPAKAASTQQISAPFTEGAQFHGTVSIDCSNSPGPTITLSGALAFDGIDLKAIFRNNVKGTHEYTDTFSVSGVLLPDGESITIPKQPVLGGAGGNPFIWVQFLDGAGHALTDEIFLGRCVQGLTTNIDPSFFLNALVTGEASIDCVNHPGPFITFGGGFTTSGLKARFIFRNNDNPVGGPHEAIVTRDFTLLSSFTKIAFPKQPSLGGAGGNPLVYLQFVDADGHALTDEIALGRCVQSKK